jgi:hypothetical protein
MPSKHDHAIALGRSWLANCLQEHTSCAKKARHANIFCSDNCHYITDLSGDGLVPSRLLSLNETDVAKLVLSSELNESTQYVALSHRWGSVDSPALPRTLESNLESHVHDGIRHEELPRTFRDTVNVTKGMGYKYLWIDSLCIIQDSSDDWKKEARRMAIIYDNAAFTIAAMDADDSTQGLFPAVVKTVSILETRAWACQERMIAPRTLMFTQNFVAWECRQASANSEFPAFKEELDGTIDGCEKEDWIAPTRLKAIFAFFRDWRLPPRDAHGTRPGVKSDKSPPHVAETLEHFNTRDVSKDLQELRICIHGASQNERNSGLSSDEGGQPAVTNEDTVIPAEIDTDPPSEKTIHPFTWSDDDPPVKVWNVPPPEGEWGVFYNQATNTVETHYGTDLQAHGQHLMSQKEYPIKGTDWEFCYESPTSDAPDPFGKFQILVTNLRRPHEAYYPFIKVWWNFLALYTPRNLTYDSDAFLAMNGISSIAQRWTHVRNTFGLWHAFPFYELCWYINPEKPAIRPTTPTWLVPSWSWASTRGGMVQNAIWSRMPMTPDLMVKPWIGGGIGTAFDMPLPFQAWRKSYYHAVKVKGQLHTAKLTRVHSKTGRAVCTLRVGPTSRRPDPGVHAFYPDCPSEWPVNKELNVWVLLVWLYDGSGRARGLGYHLEVSLVLKTVHRDAWIAHYGPHTMSREDAADERTMRRVGLLETTYRVDEEKDAAARKADADAWWKFVRLI